MWNTMEGKVETTGKLGDLDPVVLQKLEALRLFHVFIIQKKTADSFGGKVSHEIMDNRKNVIFKATRPRRIFSRKPELKVTVRNLRNVKLFSIVVESTSRPDAHESEATVYVYQGKGKKRIAHVEKFGGISGPPSYEIFNADVKTAFTLDLGAKASGSNLPGLEYLVSSKMGTVGSILIKSGLNIILCTESGVEVIEKATLIAIILAMDLLKTSTTPPKIPATNQYLLH